MRHTFAKETSLSRLAEDTRSAARRDDRMLRGRPAPGHNGEATQSRQQQRQSRRQRYRSRTTGSKGQVIRVNAAATHTEVDVRDRSPSEAKCRHPFEACSEILLCCTQQGTLMM